MLVGLVLLMLMHLGCKKDKMSFIESDNQDFAILLQYEEETVVIGESQQNEELSPAIQAAISPVVTRQKITIGINENGTSDWTILELKPKKPFDVPNDCPPDKSRKIVKTKIMNGNFFQYDENNNLLNSFKTNIPSFINLINAVKQNGNKLDRKLYSQFVDGNNTKPRTKNTIVEIKPGLSLYSKTIDASDNVRPEWYGKKVFCYYETSTMCPLAQFILDENDKWLSRKLFKYSTDANLFIPEVTQEELYETNKMGQSIITRTIKHHEGIINSVNL